MLSIIRSQNSHLLADYVKIVYSGTSYHFILLHITSYYFISLHITSYYFISLHITSCHFILLHITSYYLASNFRSSKLRFVTRKHSVGSHCTLYAVLYCKAGNFRVYPTSCFTVDWNLFATEVFCKDLQMFEIAKRTITKKFNKYIVIVVVMNFTKISIAKFFH